MKNITTTSFTELGAKLLAKLLTSKYGCTIIQNPKFDKNCGMWITIYHDPLQESTGNGIPDIQSKHTRQDKNKPANRNDNDRVEKLARTNKKRKTTRVLPKVQRARKN